MPPPARPPPKDSPKPSAAKDATLSALQRLEKLAKSGYVDQNDISMFIKDTKVEKPDRSVLRLLKQFSIEHQSSFDKAAFHKIKTFCDTYRAENDVD